LPTHSLRRCAQSLYRISTSVFIFKEDNTMSAQQLSTVAYDVIVASGNTAKNVVNAYRAGGERVAGLVEQRWDRAFKESRAQLSAETAKNATAAKQLVGGYYTKSLTVTTDSATDVIAQLVKLAGGGVERALASAHLVQAKTGITTIDTLAQATLPGVVAISTFASTVEQQSAVLARKVAGDSVLHAAKRAAKRATRA
jgi:hypothetical protein